MKVLSTFVTAVLMVAVVSEENVPTKSCPCPEDFPRELNPINVVKCPPKRRMQYGVDQHGVTQYEGKYVFALYCTKCSCGSNGYTEHCLDVTHKGLYECDEPVNPESFWEVKREIQKGDPKYDDDWGPYFDWVTFTDNRTTTTKRAPRSTTKAPDFPRETDPTKIKCPPKSKMILLGEGNEEHPWFNRYYAHVYCTNCICAENGYFDECEDFTHRGLYGCDDPDNPSKFWDGVDPDQTE